MSSPPSSHRLKHSHFRHRANNSPSPRHQTPLESPRLDGSPGRGTTFLSPSGSFGLSNNHSASTLQHSTTAWGFSRADRFPKIRSTPGLIGSPSTLNKKSTSFGFGHKNEALEIKTKRAAQVPGPNYYTIKSDFENSKAGRSFGLPHSAYAKAFIPDQAYLTPEVAKDLPGPGAYHSARVSETKKCKITIKPRGKMFNELINMDSPPSSLYSPVMTLVESSRFKSTGFGYGEKHDFTKLSNGYPGPGTYRLPSCFDKVKVKKESRKSVL